MSISVSFIVPSLHTGGIAADTPPFPHQATALAYSGFAVETHDSGEYRWVRGNLQRNHERITVRGLNHNHNTDLKNLFKSAATSASTCPGPLHDSPDPAPPSA